MADDPSEEVSEDAAEDDAASRGSDGESDQEPGLSDGESAVDAGSDNAGQAGELEDSGSDDGKGVGEEDIEIGDDDAVGVPDSDDLHVSDEDTADPGDGDGTAKDDGEAAETAEQPEGTVPVSQADEPELDMDAQQSAGDETVESAESTETNERNGSNETPEATETQVADPLPDSDRADIPDDVRTYDKFSKIEGGTYDRANEFLRERTYITAREWAIARLAADFRTETGIEMTKIGENLPELVPFMTDTYSPQAVNQARASFEEKVRKAGATFLYGAMSDFFSAEELDDIMYETTEVAKFLLEVEGVDLTVEEELEAEDRISEVMREVREHSVALRHDEVECPECGHRFQAEEDTG